MKKAYGIQQFYSTNFKTLPFDGEWLGFVGQPEPAGSWFVWGNSGNGKTVFTAKLCKYISRFGRVAYNSLEEGLSESLRRAFHIAGIEPSDNILLLDKEPVKNMTERLTRPKSPRFVVIDSFQYSGLNALTYKKLINDFGNKLFVFVSHADGKQPAGRPAKTVHYDSNVKIWVEGFRAFPKSRYGGGEPFDVWKEKTVEIWL